MSNKAAIAGVYSDLKPVKTRGVLQIVVEVPIEHADEVTRAFGWPQPGESKWLAVAAMNTEPQTAKPAREKRQWGELSRAEQAGIRCNEPEFQRYVCDHVHKLSRLDSERCAKAVRWYCGVDSRAKLDQGDAAAKWEQLDQDYRRWLRENAA